MKIREQLVSNSSSTSFMVFHNPVDLYSLLEQYNARNFPEGRYYVHGQEFGEGTDFFPMTKAMFKIIKKDTGKIDEWKWDISDVHFMKSSSNQFLKQDLVASILNVPEKFNISIIDVDYNTTEKIEDFKEKYLE